MIGDILRKARKNKKYTMSEVADMIGVTTGYISNLEKNRLDPSLTVLRDLADKLCVPPSMLIKEDIIENVTLIRADDHPRLKYCNLPCECEVLTPYNWHRSCSDEIEVIKINAPSGLVIPLDSVSGDADICIYVVSGEITYHYGTTSIKIESDNSIFIPRNTSNRIESTGKESACMIWMTKALDTINQGEAIVSTRTTTITKSSSTKSHLQLLGERIRKLRKSYGIGVKEFAETVGVSSAYISQIERNLTEPSLRVLRRIAKELNVELALLFASDMPSDVLVVTGNRQSATQLADSNTFIQLLVPYNTMDGRLPDMSVVLAYLGASQADSDESIVHDYDELCIVLEGGVEYQTPEGIFDLEENDSLYIRKGVDHTIYNRHSSDARLLVVLGSVMQRKLR